MSAAPAWYYRARDGVLGPVSTATLKRLFEQGTIDPNSPIRRGEEGPWFPAERVYDALIPVAEVESIDVTDGGVTASGGPIAGSCGEPAEWYFSREDRRKRGPVPRSVMIAMVSQGKLQPSDLVWRPGKASWVPAAELHEFHGAFSAAATPAPRGTKDSKGRHNPSSARLAGITVVIALSAFMMIVVWVWMKSGRDHAPPERAVDLANAPAISIPAAEPGLAGARPDGRTVAEGPEHLVADALAAIREGDLNRARLLLDQYLSHPGALQRPQAARVLLREVELAASRAEAGKLARRLSDQQIENYLAVGAESLVDPSVQTLELRPLYARILLQAFRQERDRRRFAMKDGVNLARGPQDNGHPVRTAVPEDAKDEKAGADRTASSSLLGSDDDIAPGPDRRDDDKAAGRPARKDATAIEAILDSPKSIEGRTFTLDGLYKVGTRLTLLKGSDGNTVGWSLPVGGNDDRLICTGEAKVVGRDAYLILDSGLATLLEEIFDQLKFKAAARPTYKCTLTVTVRSMIVNNARVPVVNIVGLEILGICDFLQVAHRQYDKAFSTVQVTPERAFVTYGDGALWVERLGGEEKFVKPLRRKLRDLQRRLVVERDHAIVGSVLQAELGRVVNMAAAAQQQQARFAASLIGAR